MGPSISLPDCATLLQSLWWLLGACMGTAMPPGKPTPSCLSPRHSLHLTAFSPHPQQHCRTPVLYQRHLPLPWPSHLLVPALMLLTAGSQSERQSTQNAPVCLTSRRPPRPRQCAGPALLHSAPAGKLVHLCCSACSTEMCCLPVSAHHSTSQN